MRNYIVIFLLFFGWCLLSFSQSPYIFKRLTMADGMVSNYIVDIIQDKQGYIWMASESGLCKFDGKDFTIYNIGNSAIGSNAHNALYYNEADNTVWVGTQRDGISIFDNKTQTFITNGVNGVILITTKRGKSGKPNIRYSGYVGFEDFSHKLKFGDGAQILQRYKDYVAQNPGETLFNGFVKNHTSVPLKRDDLNISY
jgi:hypothetical protein